MSHEFKSEDINDFLDASGLDSVSLLDRDGGPLDDYLFGPVSLADIDEWVRRTPGDNGFGGL